MEDIFRKKYTPISEKKKKQIDEIKDAAQKLYQLIDGSMNVKNAEYFIDAERYLEISVMLATKGLTS